MRYIARNLEKVVLEVTKEYPVVLVTGPRQVGKTTMLQKLMEGTDRNYVSLDDLNERNLAKTDPEMFLQLHKPPILIDEVQYAPELFVYIKIHVDKYHNAGDFWLTGSQVFKWMSGIQESSGRQSCRVITYLVVSGRDLWWRDAALYSGYRKTVGKTERKNSGRYRCNI